MALGDFNAVFGAHKKKGGNVPNRVSCSDFMNMTNDGGLISLDLKGSFFTGGPSWLNGNVPNRVAFVERSNGRPVTGQTGGTTNI